MFIIVCTVSCTVWLMFVDRVRKTLLWACVCLEMGRYPVHPGTYPHLAEALMTLKGVNAGLPHGKPLDLVVASQTRRPFSIAIKNHHIQ